MMFSNTMCEEVSNLKKREYKSDLKMTAKEKFDTRKRYSIATQYTKRVDPPLYFYVLESWN